MKTTTKLSSKCIYEFYKQLEAHGIENHGLLIIKDGKTVYEEYSYPYSADMPHTLFSVTKSIVSTAVGFAIEEGLVSLDTKIADVFPTHEMCKGDGWNELTLRSVLTMNSNKEFSFLQDMTDDYVEMFMKAQFRKDKGFLYSNNDAHIAAAVVHKVTGMSIADYLMPRLFAPLGIEKPFWETNEKGECIGGTGCYLKLSDLAKIMLCYSQGGKYNGVQVIPEFWTKEATKIQHRFSENSGYGYLFWIDADIYSMTGMFGQIIAYSKKHNAIIASMNSGVNEDSHTRLLNEVLVKALDGENTEEYDEHLNEYLKSRGVKPAVCGELPNIHFGKTYYLTSLSDKIAKAVFPQSVIPRALTCSFAKRPKNNLNKVVFSKTENALSIKWEEEEDKITINCGIDGKPQITECSIKGYPYKLWAYAYTENGKLKAVVKPLNTLATHYITFDFQSKYMKMKFNSTPDFTGFIIRSAISPDFFKKHKIIKNIAMGFLKLSLEIMQRPLKFKVK